MSWIINVGIGLLVLPSLLIVIIPLVDQVFNLTFMDYFTSVVSGLNTLMGSNEVNMLLVCLSIIMFLLFFRWCLRIIGLTK